MSGRGGGRRRRRIKKVSERKEDAMDSGDETSGRKKKAATEKDSDEEAFAKAERDSDEEAFAKAHGPPALWANYLATRQQNSPLYVDPNTNRQRAVIKMRESFLSRYLCLRFGQQIILCEEAKNTLKKSDAFVVCITLFEKRDGRLLALESSMPLPAVTRHDINQEDHFLDKEIQEIQFHTDVSPYFASESLMISIQLLAKNDDDTNNNKEAIEATPMSREEAMSIWPVSRFQNRPHRKATHAALIEFEELVDTKVLTHLSTYKPATRGGFLRLPLTAKIFNYSTLFLRLGARLDMLPPQQNNIPYIILPSAKGEKIQKMDIDQNDQIIVQELDEDEEPRLVVYHLLYRDAQKRIKARMQQVAGLQCPWCMQTATSARLLLFHLVTNHSPSIAFQAAFKHYEMHILAAPRQLQSTDLFPDTCDDDDLALQWIIRNSDDTESLLPEIPRLDRGDEAQGLEIAERAASQLLKKLADIVRPSFLQLNQHQEESRPRPVYPPVRQYYHSRTGAPMTLAQAMDPDYDSDNEIDERWRLDKADRLLEEFEDVTDDEKSFMKLWNRFVHAHPISADRRVPVANLAFAIENAKALVDLRHCFLLHLFHLYDNSLVNAEHIAACLAVVDDPLAISIQLNGNDEHDPNNPLSVPYRHPEISHNDLPSSAPWPSAPPCTNSSASSANDGNNQKRDFNESIVNTLPQAVNNYQTTNNESASQRIPAFGDDKLAAAVVKKKRKETKPTKKPSTISTQWL